MTLVSEEDDRAHEIQYVKQALKANNYPDWMHANNIEH